MDADGKIVIETEIDSKAIDNWFEQLPNEAKTKLAGTQKQIESLSKRYGELVERYLELTNPTKGVPIFKSDIKEANTLKKELESITKELEKITGDKIIGISGIKEFKNEVSKSSKSVTSDFKKMANTIKKFGLSLIGLRSLYSLVSRASSAYLSQDTELAEKLRSVWVGLGSFLAPVLEMISNSLLKALGYLNEFIKALTGVDYLARANAKALQKQASAQKEVNNQTYDFDVIRKQQDNTSNNVGVMPDGQMFKIPELDEKIVNKLKDLATWLRTNEDLVKKVGIALLGVFGTVAVAKVIKGIATLMGTEGVGLIGLKSILTGLLSIGVITLGVNLLYDAWTGRDLIEDLKTIKKGFDDLKKITEKTTKSEKQQTQNLKNFNEEMQEKIKNGDIDKKNLSAYTDLLKYNTRATAEQIRNIQSNTVITKSMRKEEEALREQLGELLSAYGYLYDQGLLNEDETKDYAYALAIQAGITNELGYNVDELTTKYQELTGQEWNIKLTATDYASSTLDKIINKINELYKLTKTEGTAGSSGGAHSGGSGRHESTYSVNGISTQPIRTIVGNTVSSIQSSMPSVVNSIANLLNGATQAVNVYLDGRLIQRQNANVTNQKDFATNR